MVDRAAICNKPNFKDRIVDALMDGPSTIAELARWMDVPIARIAAAMEELLAAGLVEVKAVLHTKYGRDDRLFDVARTKKSTGFPAPAEMPKRRPELVVVSGRSMSLHEVSRTFGIADSTLRSRLDAGMSAEEAITAPATTHSQAARMAQSPWRTKPSVRSWK